MSPDRRTPSPSPASFWLLSWAPSSAAGSAASSSCRWRPSTCEPIDCGSAWIESTNRFWEAAVPAASALRISSFRSARQVSIFTSGVSRALLPQPGGDMDELQHECGVAALYYLPGRTDRSSVWTGDPDQLSRHMPRMLLDLQNRGQLAAGMSSYNPNRDL